MQFSDFLRYFVVGKNNGGCASFQVKRAQQVSCLSITVVYIVLYVSSEIYAIAPESLASLQRSSDQDKSRSIRGGPQACFGFHKMISINAWWSALSRETQSCETIPASVKLFRFPWIFPFSWTNLSFCFHFLDLISKPIFVWKRNDFARVTDWYPDVDWSRSSTLVKKKVWQRPASRWPAPRPQVSSPPFSTAKKSK